MIEPLPERTVHSRTVHTGAFFYSWRPYPSKLSPAPPFGMTIKRLGLHKSEQTDQTDKKHFIVHTNKRYASQRNPRQCLY